MRFRTHMTALAASLLLTMPALAQSKVSQSHLAPSVPTIPESQIEPNKVATTYEFVATASSANAFEIEAAKLALQMAQSPDLRSFAQTMLDDHTAAQEELLATGKAANTDIAKPQPDGEQQGLLDGLESAEPERFDALYVDSQIFAHQRALALFKGYAEGNDPLNLYAAEALPTLQKHYGMILEIAGKMQSEAAAQ